jgi:SAM-dependent methyltransferase
VNSTEAGTPTSARSLRLRIVALTFLMLFVELALIRWLGASVLYLSYFSNVVLLGSFLGVGLGFLWAGRFDIPLLRFTPLLLGAFVVFIHVVPVRVVAAGGDLIFFGSELRPSGPPRELMLPAIFVAVALIMASIGDGIARTFRQLANLDAYKFDLIGSLVGTVAFAILAFLGAEPIVWGVVAAAVMLWAIRPRSIATAALVVLPLVGLLGTLTVESRQPNTVWTPYYKATYAVLGDQGIGVFVNGIPHWFQISPQNVPVYQTLYDRRATSAEGADVLVIGAGSGNDVAKALKEGAAHVDAVEIDSRLLDLASEYHPDRPYDDPRVTTHIDDGRAFLEKSDKKWDMIILALPDSLTLVQGASSIRLESYLFTQEAADAYHDHLKDDGVFSMYNLYREDWLVERYANTLDTAFGHAPCVTRLSGTSIAVLATGRNAAVIDCPDADQWTRTASTPAPVSDDRPFPYLKQASIPSFYLVALGLILLVSLLGVRLVGGPLRGIGAYADLFFMGVAFLLLETKNVVQFALLFGTTWLVNALVFGGVLVAVLAAVTISQRFRVRRPLLLYGLLAASIVVSWSIPPHVLLDLPFWPRMAAAVVLAFLPIFLANMVFAQRFRDTGDTTTAFAANLIGAMVGGVLEYTSLILGYRNLMIVALALYGLAFLFGRRHLVAPRSAG